MCLLFWKIFTKYKYSLSPPTLSPYKQMGNIWLFLFYKVNVYQNPRRTSESLSLKIPEFYKTVSVTKKDKYSISFNKNLKPFEFSFTEECLENFISLRFQELWIGKYVYSNHSWLLSSLFSQKTWFTRTGHLMHSIWPHNQDTTATIASNPVKCRVLCWWENKPWSL